MPRGFELLSIILGGAGQGIGAAGNVVAKGREEAIEREKLAAEVRRREEELGFRREDLAEQRRQFDEGRFTPVPFTAIPENMRQGLTPDASGMVRYPLGALPWLQKVVERAEARAGAERGAAYLERAGAPGPAPGEDPEATILRPPNQRALAAAGLLRETGTTSGLDALLKTLYPEAKPAEPFTLGARQRRFGPTGALIAEGAESEPKEPTQANASARLEAAIQNFQALRDDPAYGPDHRKTKNAYELVMGLSQAIPVTEGGRSESKAAFLSLIPHSTPAATPGVTPQRPGVIQGPPKQPESGERKTIAETNALITLGRGLLQQWRADPKVFPSTTERLGEREIALGIRPSTLIGPTMTPTQRRFFADATDLQATYRALRSGLAVTNPEAVRSMPLVPDDPGGLTIEQLEALTAWAERNRAEIDRALIAANRAPGPPPQAPAPAPGGTPRERTYNRATGRIE